MTMLPAMKASGAGRHGWAPTNRAHCTEATAVCVCVHVCSRTRVRACVRDVFAIDDIIINI